MTRKNLRWLLRCFQVLADEPCLTLVSMLAQGEREINELAESLNVPEAVIAPHLVNLRMVGLVQLRVHKTRRTCRLNTAVLAEFKAAVEQMEMLPEMPVTDNAWMDAMNLNDFERKVLRDHTVNGRIQALPERDKKVIVILRWIATKFQAGIDYAEQEVNAILTQYFEDYVTLRRELINFGLMKRERDGSRYWIVKHDG